MVIETDSKDFHSDTSWSNRMDCMVRARKMIGLFHHVGGGNLGDDATLDAVMWNIRQRWPHAVIIALSINPDDTRKRHGIPAYPISAKAWSFGYAPARTGATLKEAVKNLTKQCRILFRLLSAANALAIRLPRAVFRELSFLAASFRVIRSLNLLVISGGGQLTEQDGPWAFPYTIFKWILLAKFARVKRVFLNVGAGPLTHPVSRFFAKRALLAADYVSFRDGQSQALSQEIGFKEESLVFPDCAYSLEVPATDISSFEKREWPVVGIGPVPYGYPRLGGAEGTRIKYEDFIAKCAVFASGLIRRSYSLTLFGTDIGFDPLAIEDLQTALRNRHSVTGLPYDSVKSAKELLAAMNKMDYVVTCRFHGVVFAHLLNKPVLAISRHPKVATLMNDIGLSEYCVDIDSFEADSLLSTFRLLVENGESIKGRLAAALARYRGELASQFDDLFPRATPAMPCRDSQSDEKLEGAGRA